MTSHSFLSRNKLTYVASGILMVLAAVAALFALFLFGWLLMRGEVESLRDWYDLQGGIDLYDTVDVLGDKSFLKILILMILFVVGSVMIGAVVGIVHAAYALETIRERNIGVGMLYQGLWGRIVQMGLASIRIAFFVLWPATLVWLIGIVVAVVDPLGQANAMQPAATPNPFGFTLPLIVGISLFVRAVMSLQYAFTSYAIIDGHRARDAMNQSVTLMHGKYLDYIGAAGLASSIYNLFTRIPVIGPIFMLFIGANAMVGAYRYDSALQLQVSGKPKPKTSGMNWVAILVAIALFVIVGIVTDARAPLYDDSDLRLDGLGNEYIDLDDIFGPDGRVLDQ